MATPPKKKRQSPGEKRPSLEELYIQSRQSTETRPSLEELYAETHGVQPAPATAERPGFFDRLLNRAAVSGMQTIADIGEMMAGIPSPGARPVADLPAARAQGVAGARSVRAAATELEAKVPEAEGLLETVASGAGYVAPDVLATLTGTKLLQSVARGLRPASTLGRLLAPEATAGVIRRNIPGAIAAAPLVTLPSAVAEGSTRSATGALGEMLTGERPGVGTRIAGDIAIDVLGGAAAEKLLINPLARILGKQAKAAPAAAPLVEEMADQPLTQKVLMSGAYQMPSSTEQFRQAGIDEIMRRTREQVDQARAMGPQPVPPPVVEPVVPPVTPRDQMLLGAGETPLMLGAGEPQALLPRVQTPLLLQRGAIRMGPVGWREREQLEAAIKFAEEQRAGRPRTLALTAPAAAPEVELSPTARLEAAAQQARAAATGAPAIEIPTALSPRTTRQQKNLRRQMAQSAQQIQADIDDRRAMAMPDMEATRQLEAAAEAGRQQRAVLDRFRAPRDAGMGGMDAGAAGAAADRLAGGAAAPEAAVRPAAADALGAGGPAVQAAPGDVTKALGGTAFDIGGAFGASLGTQFGREALPKIGLGVAGYELEESVEDPRLKATGQGLQLLSMASLGYRPSKALIRSGAINVRDALAQSPQGRTALNLISRDILIDPKVKEVVELAEREMAKYRAIGLDLAQQARKLGPEGDRLVSDLVENERIESRAGMDDETIKAAMAVAQKVAQEVSGLGREKVATGIISKETYDRRMASYLKRFYAAFKGAEAMQGVTIRKGGKIFRIEPERVRNENLSLEERNALGEIREASVRLGETFTEGGRNIATSRLFNALAGIDGVIPPVYKQAMDEAENARLLSDAAYASGDAEMGKAARSAEREAKRRMKGLAQEIASSDNEYIVLPDTPKLSFLRGAVVRKDAAEYLMTMPDIGIERLGTRGLFGELTRFWKRVHTVYNPGTHVGNFISNASKVHMGGLPLAEQPGYLKDAWSDLRNYGPATKALAEAGVLERGLPTYGDMAVSGLASQKNTLQQLVETTRPETRQALTARGVTPRSDLRKAAGWASQKAQQAYALEDGLYRVALYKKFLDNNMAPDEALREVERVLPGYDTRSPLLTGIKNTVSPFIMYPVKYIPSLMEDIMDHPVRWVTLAALWGGLDQLSRRMYTPVQDRDLRPEQRQSKSLGHLMPGTIQVDALMRPLAKALDAEPKRGEQYTFDISRFTPLSLFSGSPAPGSVVGKLFPEVPGASILQPSGFIPELASRAFNIDPFTGRKWMTGGETPMQKAQMIAEDVVLPFVTPTAISYYGKKMVKETIPGENRAEMLSNVMGLLGVRPQLVRPGVQAKYERQDFMEQIRAVKAKRDAQLRNTESPQRRKELMQEAAADLQRIRNKYYAKRIELGGGENK